MEAAVTAPLMMKTTLVLLFLYGLSHFYGTLLWRRRAVWERLTEFGLRPLELMKLINAAGVSG